MINTEIKIKGDFFSVLVTGTGAPGDRARAAITWEKYKADELVDPSFILQKVEAQKLMDELYKAGIVPTLSCGSKTDETNKALQSQVDLLGRLLEKAMALIEAKG